MASEKPEKTKRQALDGAVLRSIVDTAVDGIVTIDEVGTIITANPAVERILGYKATEIIGQNVRVLMPPPYHEEHDSYLENYRGTGRRKIIGIGREVRGQHKDGHEVPIELSVSETIVDGKKIFTGIMHDITQQKAAAEAVRRQHSLLMAVVNAAIDVILTINEKGEIITVNKSIEPVFGYKPEELIGQNVRILMGSPYRQDHDTYLRNYIRTGEKKIIGIGREVIGRKKSGEEFDVEIAVSETHTESGRIFTGIIRDISERKASEQAIRKERGLLKAVVEAAVDGILTIDQSGNIITANPAAFRIFGYSHEELIGQNVKMLMPEPYHSEHDSYLNNYLQTGEKKIIGIGREVKGRRKDGSEFPLELAVNETHTEEGTIFTGILRDITQRKLQEEQINNLNADLERRVVERTQQLQELVEELEGFCHSIAHDLRQPLRGINFNARILIEDYSQKLNGEGTARLEALARAAAKMGKVMDDLLGYARLGRVVIKPSKVNLSEIAAQISKGLGSEADFEIEPNLEATGDPALLQIVIQNLLDNAYKYRRPGVRPRIVFGKQGNSYYVRDNGAGFDMRYAHKLFEPFERLHSEEEYPGNGIGLANVQRILQKHGGKIWGESIVNEGTTFYFTIDSEIQEAS